MMRLLLKEEKIGLTVALMRMFRWDHYWIGMASVFHLCLNKQPHQAHTKRLFRMNSRTDLRLRELLDLNFFVAVLKRRVLVRQ
jgi:hypothetical protein